MAAGAFNAFVLGRTAEEQTLPDLGEAALDQARARYPTIAAGMAERAHAGDSADVGFDYSMTIMITGLRTLADQRL